MMIHLLLRAVQRDTTGCRQLVTASLGHSRHTRKFDKAVAGQDQLFMATISK